jgi:hypothetical protein
VRWSRRRRRSLPSRAVAVALVAAGAAPVVAATLYLWPR